MVVMFQTTTLISTGMKIIITLLWQMTEKHNVPKETFAIVAGRLCEN